MQVLIAYPFTSEIRDRHQLIYLPELVQDEASLGVAIRQHCPHVIIVGNNAVGSQTLGLWRSVMGNDVQLTLIRRGSSLSRIDIHKAEELHINVLNTLSVNSRFVAEYMIEHLHLPINNSSATVAIIGSGAIGSRIAERLSANQHKIYIYSPSLTNPDGSDLERIRRRKGLASDRINISITPEEAVKNATHIILAIDADRVVNVKQQLSKEFFQLIPNGARLVSVTEFRVFAEGAIDILIERVRQGQLTARLDSPAFDLITIKDPPATLETVSAAMKGPGCGEAMDQAALVVLANVALEQSFKSTLSFSINSSEKFEEITIIGAGILGLTTALFLSQNGYTVTVIDEHSHPGLKNNLNEHEISCRGTTIDGCDARHASVTETMPHAVFFRKDSLRKCPSDRGWRIISGQFDDRERSWIDRFIELAGYPELVVNLFNQFVSDINRRGIELWEEIFRLFPQIVKDSVRNHRLIRVCSSLVLLNVVLSFQTKYHKNDDNVQRLSHAQVLERIPGLVLNDGDAGGIEVPGFTINVQQFCLNLINYLESNQNVTFKWSTQIRSIDQIHSQKIIFASSLGQFQSSLLDNISLAVQGVVGCWTKVTNIHSRTNGFKITEKEPIGVINVTPSCDGHHLYITGGFGYCGQRGIVQSPYLNQLIDLFNSTIRSYLPDEFEASESEMSTTKFCIRPMTPDGMPIVAELNNQKKNKIYFLGGTNAGGFVEAPLLASLLLDLIRGSNSNTTLCHVYNALRLDRNTLQFNLNSSL